MFEDSSSKFVDVLRRPTKIGEVFSDLIEHHVVDNMSAWKIYKVWVSSADAESGITFLGRVQNCNQILFCRTKLLELRMLQENPVTLRHHWHDSTRRWHLEGRGGVGCCIGATVVAFVEKLVGLRGAAGVGDIGRGLGQLVEEQILLLSLRLKQLCLPGAGLGAEELHDVQAGWLVGGPRQCACGPIGVEASQAFAGPRRSVGGPGLFGTRRRSGAGAAPRPRVMADEALSSVYSGQKKACLLSLPLLPPVPGGFLPPLHGSGSTAATIDNSSRRFISASVQVALHGKRGQHSCARKQALEAKTTQTHTLQRIRRPMRHRRSRTRRIRQRRRKRSCERLRPRSARQQTRRRQVTLSDRSRVSSRSSRIAENLSCCYPANQKSFFQTARIGWSAVQRLLDHVPAGLLGGLACRPHVDDAACAHDPG